MPGFLPISEAGGSKTEFVNSHNFRTSNDIGCPKQATAVAGDGMGRARATFGEANATKGLMGMKAEVAHAEASYRYKNDIGFNAEASLGKVCTIQ